jgi:hypothetical protein
MNKDKTDFALGILERWALLQNASYKTCARGDKKEGA